MKINKIFQVGLVILLTLSAVGCQNDDSIEKYNELSQEHQQSITEAFDELNNSITYYNNKEYEKSESSAQKCKKLFSQTKDISTEAKKVAENIKDKQWLVEYKQYSIQAETLREEQCQYLIDVSIASENKEVEKSQEIIDNISKVNNEYNKIQTTLEDIKAQHPDSFNNETNN